MHSEMIDNSELCEREALLPRHSTEDRQMADKEYHVVPHLIGDFGRWQATISLLVSLLKLPIAWFQLAIVFLAPTDHKFWCADTPELISTCNETCGRYEFDTSVFSSTIISEWELVCDRGQLPNVVQMTFMLGVLVGNLIFGMASDRFGRKRPLMIAIFLQAITSFILAFIPWFWGFLLMRFLLAISTGGTMVTSFVLCVEVVGGKWRTSIPILYQIPFGLANSMMAAMAYFLRDWRQLTVTMACLSALFISYEWLIPESPRWLIATGAKQEAAVILKDAARVNRLSRTDIDSILSSEPAVSKTTNNGATFFELFRHPNLRRITLCLFFNWFIAGMSVFGFTQYMSSLGETSDIYLNFALGGLVTVPGTILCIYVVRRFGRRSSIVLSGLVYGTSCMLVAIVPQGHFTHDWPRIMLSAVSLTGMAITFPALYLYSGELLPTVARNGGMGAASMFARLGSMLAPFVLTTKQWHESIPLIILGGIPVLAVMLLLPLPETRGCALPDTLEDGENFGKMKKEESATTTGSYIQINPVS